MFLSPGSESEAGSARVTPVQKRRHNVHPHRRGRKVSAPPELQPHLGQHPRKPSQGGAITEPTEKTPPKEFYIIPPQNKLTEGIYGSTGGSDSGVPSEYSSYALPVKGHQRKERLHFEDDLRSADGSVEDLVDEKSRRNSEVLYNSESEAESGDLHSPMPSQRHGVDNVAYEPDVSHQIVEGPPQLTRSITSGSFVTSDMIANMSPVDPSVDNRRDRTNSCVLQLAVGPNQVQNATMANSRSVSLYSLNHAGVNTLPNGYPSLSHIAQDNQSIYSECGGQYQTGYLGTQNIQVIGSTHGSVVKDGSHAASSHAPSHPEDGEPEPTSESEKRKWTIDTVSDNLSLMYAMFIVSLGFVIYLADIFSGHDSVIAESFNIYLMVAQIIFLGYLHIDIRHYCHRVAKALQKSNYQSKESINEVSLNQTEGNLQIRINMPESRNVPPQHYGFTSGRHGGSLYLKIGATVFCFGHLIHSGLNLGQKILYLTADDGAFEACTCMSDVIASVLQPVYAFYNLFFVYKYSNLVINKRPQLAKFGMMHCISASISFWIYTIMQETLQAIYAKKKKGDYNVTTTTPYPLASLVSLKGGDDSDEMFDDHAMEMIKKSIYSVKKYGTDEWNINYGCEQTTELTEMINYTTPYLYPFSIEYNLLIVGVWILIFENILRMDRHTHMPSVEMQYEDNNAKEIHSNMVIYVDCHSSNRGFFFGLLMTVGTVISVILYFIFTSSEHNVNLGLYVKAYSELILLLVMGIGTFSAFNAVRTLDVVKHSVSKVDDILLIICIPCILLYAFFNMVPSMINGNGLFVIVYILQGIQAIMQTVFIGDGLRRCSNSADNQNRKPGREVVTFLVVANVALWLLETFEIKNDAGNADKYDFYGKNLWTMISHLTLPLALFYRFHSSVCLADIWKSAYEPELEH